MRCKEDGVPIKKETKVEATRVCIDSRLTPTVVASVESGKSSCPVGVFLLWRIWKEMERVGGKWDWRLVF